jgi:hypothetical protein
LSGCGQANRVLIPDTLPARNFHGCDDIREGLEAFTVAVGDRPTLLVPLVEVAQLDLQNCRLDGIEATVDPDGFIEVAIALSVVAKDLDLGGEGGIICGDCAAISGGTEVLSREKTETAEVPNAADALPLPSCAS